MDREAAPQPCPFTLLRRRGLGFGGFVTCSKDATFEQVFDAFTKALTDGDDTEWATHLNYKDNLERATPLGMFDWLVQFCASMNSRNKERNATIERLEARVAELEARPSSGTKDAGPWKTGTTYFPGDIVSFQGSGWIAKETNVVRPNDPELGHRAWRLLVKRGAYDSTR
jgi:hypothetical protein